MAGTGNLSEVDGRESVGRLDDGQRAERVDHKNDVHRSGDADRVDFDDAFLRRLERLSLRVGRLTGAVGSRPGVRRTPAADFIDHRPYSPGDDLRHIDWPAAARHEDVFVKVGRAPQAAQVHLLVDLSTSMVADPAKRRLALELVAALGWLSLVNGDRVTVGCLPMAADESLRAPLWGPASGAGFGRGLLRFLADLPREVPGVSRVAPSLARLVRMAPVGGRLVLVSDLWVADDLEMALAMVPPPRWEVLVLQVLGRGELEPELAGLVELVDSETGERTDLLVDENLRAAYRSALNARLERLRTLLGARGAEHALLPADWPLEQAVVPYLQRRSLIS